MIELEQYRPARDLLEAELDDNSSIAWHSAYCDVLCRMHNQSLAKKRIQMVLTRLGLPYDTEALEAPVITDNKIRIIAAHLVSKLAELAYDFGEYVMASAEAKRAIALALPDDNRFLSGAYLLLARSQMEEEQYDLAILAGNKAIDCATAFYGEDVHIQVAKIRVAYAYLLLDGPDREKRRVVADKVKAELEKLAENNHVEAIERLAWAYDHGVFVEFNEKFAKHKAFALYEQAAQQGHVKASLHLAGLYQAEKVPATHCSRYEYRIRAHDYLKRVADTSFHAQYELADMIASGQGRAEKMSKQTRLESSFTYYQNAAMSGLAVAEYALGRCYLTDQLPESMLLEQQYRLAQASTWLDKAKAQGNINAARLLVLMHWVTADEAFKKETYWQIVCWLFDDARPALHFAAQHGYVEGIQALVDTGIVVNQKQLGTGERPLHDAAYYGSLSAYQVLVAHGATLTVRSNNGRSALHYAAQGGHPDILAALLSSGLDVNAAAADGQRALHIAAGTGKLSAYQVLVAHGAALTVPANNGWSALHYAADGGHPDILAALLSSGLGECQRPMARGCAFWQAVRLPGAGSPWDRADGTGMAGALHYAAQGGHPDILAALLSSGLDVNAAAADGKRALHIAALSGHLSAYQVLVAHGAATLTVQANNRLERPALCGSRRPSRYTGCPAVGQVLM